MKAQRATQFKAARKTPAKVTKAPLHEVFNREELFERRKLALAQAAIRAFNRHGYHATSMDKIAAELGLTKGTLYHYYKSKTDLLYDCWLLGIEDGKQMAETAAAGGGCGVEKLERFLRLQFQTLAGSAGSSWLSPDFSALPDAQKADVRKKSRAVDAMVQQFIADGVADGSIIATEPKIAKFFLIGALNRLPRWFSPEGRISSDDLATIFIRIVLDGLRAKAP